MASSQQFCLKWNNHQSNLISVFDDLLNNQEYVDVTLACEGHNIKAHKMVLSACSPFFQDLFKNNPCKHPIVIMKDMKYTDLKAVVRFMYKGEVNVSQDKLSTLLKTAESLQIKGLAEVANESANEQSTESQINSRQDAAEPSINYRPSSHQSSHQSLPQSSQQSSPVSKRRKRRHSNENSSVPIESANSSSNSEVIVPSTRLSSSQYQPNASSSSSQSRVPPDSQPSGSSSSAPMFSEIKLKSEVIDEPDIIPIPIEQEISRVKSSPVETIHDTNETSYDESSYQMMEQNMSDMSSSQAFVSSENFVPQLSESSQGAQPDDSMISQGGEIQYQDDVGGDLALSYMESGNTNMSEELSPGPSSLPQDGSSADRGSGLVSRRFNCPVCNQLFRRKWNMESHCVKTHGYQREKLPCKICGKLMKRRNDFIIRNSEDLLERRDKTIHKRQRTETKEGKGYKTAKKRLAIDFHAGCVMLCSLGVLSSVNHLKMEIKSNCLFAWMCIAVSVVTGPKPRSCPACSKSFATRSSMLRHYHHFHVAKGESYHCPHCIASFSWKITLQKHIRDCHSGRKYQCHACKKDLEIFVVILGIKSTTCPTCLYDFTARHSMLRHYRHVHAQPNVRFKCPLCTKTFKWKFHLKDHLHSVHRLDHKFHCSICRKGFQYVNVLRRHMKSEHLSHSVA
ncbi:Protein bric-a-brac 2 [Nymphon striatum]|nr:Protein bric-a-brac 2 [Nymphon striatum]